MVAGLLGILKAGAAYVPMDPAYPRDRIATMLEDSRAPVVLTLERLRDALPPTTANVVAIDAPASTTETASRRECARATGSDLAYVIFTSGSTGRPKGVKIEHRNVSSFFAGMDARLGARARRVARGHEHLVRHLGARALLDARARLQGRRAGGGRPASRPAGAGPVGVPSTRAMGFSLFYFAADRRGTRGRGQVPASCSRGRGSPTTHGFVAVWTPERHFHAFGGLYPNPSVTSAAIAVIDQARPDPRRERRPAAPRPDPLSRRSGRSSTTSRAGASACRSRPAGTRTTSRSSPGQLRGPPGGHGPGIETVRKLWRGEEVPAKSGDGQRRSRCASSRRPVQKEPPISDHRGRQPGDLRAGGPDGRQRPHEPARADARRTLTTKRRALPRGAPRGGPRRRGARHAHAPHLRRRRTCDAVRETVRAPVHRVPADVDGSRPARRAGSSPASPSPARSARGRRRARRHGTRRAHPRRSSTR